MKRNLVKALGALALGWLAGTADAQTRRTKAPETLPQTVQLGTEQPDEPLGAKARAAQAPSTLTGTCMDHCCDPGKSWLFGGGGQLIALTPAFDPNPAFRLITTAGTTRAANQVDFVWGLKTAYSGWLEAVNAPSGTGFRGRAFTFHQSETMNTDGFLPAAGTTQGIASAAPLGLGFSSLDTTFVNTGGGAGSDRALFWSEMNLDMYDVDFTFALPRLGALDMTVFWGSRYVHLQQTYTATAVTPSGSIVPAGVAVTVDGSHNFNGGGTTFGVDLKQRLGESALSFYAKPRGSFLIGTAREGATRIFTPAAGGAPISVGGSPAITAVTLNNMDVLPVVEIETGAELGRYFGRTRQAYAFVSMGSFAQIFFGAGNAANNSNMNSNIPGVAPAIGATPYANGIFSQDRGNFLLWGNKLSFGITF